MSSDQNAASSFLPGAIRAGSPPGAFWILESIWINHVQQLKQLCATYKKIDNQVDWSPKRVPNTAGFCSTGWPNLGDQRRGSGGGLDRWVAVLEKLDELELKELLTPEDLKSPGEKKNPVVFVVFFFVRHCTAIWI